MGLTAFASGRHAAAADKKMRENEDEIIVALAGNPNVGKSTVFNALTGMRQHTGNWAGKTVANARGTVRHGGKNYVLVDIPGAYSLTSLSAEEELARDFICFGGASAVVIICDATCLERNLNLVLQTLEITPHAAVCVNLLDEAKKKNINVNLAALERLLGVPVCGTQARSGHGISCLMDCAAKAAACPSQPYAVRYPEAIESAVSMLVPQLEAVIGGALPARWVALKLLERDAALISAIESHLGVRFEDDPAVTYALGEAFDIAGELAADTTAFRDAAVSAIYAAAEQIVSKTVTEGKRDYNVRQLKIDRVLTRRSTGVPIMLALLSLVFYITIRGANYPSELLSSLFSDLSAVLSGWLINLGAPAWLHGMLISGVYKTLAWVIAVMLPPMAIFFPMFTLLEDLGYLPRVAFNLDNTFRRCRACGKQALTMCMGFGCNAAGIIGCRIIESPRERLIAMITNNFVPCNGRFPMLLALISMFFVGSSMAHGAALLSAVLLTLFIVLGILMTFLVSYILSATILKGVPSSLTLEMPPFRRPQVGKVIVRSVLDRTLFVLGRAAVVTAPAGLVIWLLASVTVDGATLLSVCTGFLDPAAKLFGLDGVILIAFIVGIPANEIVLPVILMTYTATSSLVQYESLDALRELLVDNGWTWLTAVCTMLFSLMHWPCATSLMTIKKETKSLRWTIAAFLVPTVCGILICFFVASLARLFHLV